MQGGSSTLPRGLFKGGDDLRNWGTAGTRPGSPAARAVPGDGGPKETAAAEQDYDAAARCDGQLGAVVAERMAESAAALDAIRGQEVLPSAGGDGSSSPSKLRAAVSGIAHGLQRPFGGLFGKAKGKVAMPPPQQQQCTAQEIPVAAAFLGDHVISGAEIQASPQHMPAEAAELIVATLVQPEHDVLGADLETRPQPVARGVFAKLRSARIAVPPEVPPSQPVRPLTCAADATSAAASVVKLDTEMAAAGQASVGGTSRGLFHRLAATLRGGVGPRRGKGGQLGGHGDDARGESAGMGLPAVAEEGDALVEGNVRDDGVVELRDGLTASGQALAAASVEDVAETQGCGSAQPIRLAMLVTASEGCALEAAPRHKAWDSTGHACLAAVDAAASGSCDQLLLPVTSSRTTGSGGALGAVTALGLSPNWPPESGSRAVSEIESGTMPKRQNLESAQGSTTFAAAALRQEEGGVTPDPQSEQHPAAASVSQHVWSVETNIGMLLHCHALV
jgi:hypothetical protein